MNISRPIRLLVCDDSAVIRRALREFLEVPNVQIVGEADSGQAAIAAALAAKPDVVLMDVNMPGMDGIEATREIVARVSGVRVLAYSAESDAATIGNMAAAGAHGYCLKSARAEELLRAIRTVAAQKPFFAPPEPRATDSPSDE